MNLSLKRNVMLIHTQKTFYKIECCVLFYCTLELFHYFNRVVCTFFQSINNYPNYESWVQGLTFAKNHKAMNRDFIVVWIAWNGTLPVFELNNFRFYSECIIFKPISWNPDVKASTFSQLMMLHKQRQSP